MTMKTKLAFCLCLLAFCFTVSAQTEKPLRVFIRAGVKTHGPGAHDGPRFLADWPPMLRARGMVVDGAIGFPTGAQLDATDVMVMYTAEGGTITPDQRAELDKFLKRGGGLVVIHDSVCGTDPQWFKTVIGGAWEHGHSKWYEGKVGLYFVDHDHPITRGLSNFEFDDEIYWDLHMMPEARVLATSFHSVFNIAPQMWVYEKDNYRAFVCVPGHNYTSFNLPHFRALILRGIAWAGKLPADRFVNAEELASLAYPEGGPTAPAKAAEKIVVHPEFKINLVAAEPLIEKPISLDWDASGRLWVAETVEYPNGRRINPADDAIAVWRQRDPQNFHGEFENRPARDRISILEDTNGDGVMDKKTVFFDGLELVTSLVLYRDGVIVSQAPDIYWLRDTHGAGKADQKVVLYTGFGTMDAHAVISNLRWGMDGWIYATVGYSRGDIWSGDHKKHFGKITDGVIRFRPDGSAIEEVCAKGSNTWGMDFAWDDELFFSQANGNHVDHVVMPEAALARGRVGSTPSYKVIEDHNRSFPILQSKEQAYLQIDNVGGFTAASGACLYTGGAWPEKYNYSYFVAEPTVNLVHQDFITPDGVSYVARKEREEEFVAGTDLWFRPIHQRVGPDGALYILDFYNQAVVHNDTRGPKHGANNAAVRPDRDHYFGRIWRVQHKDAKTLPVVRLGSGVPRRIEAAFTHPNGWVRMTALRLLIEEGGAGQVGTLEKLTTATNQPTYGRLTALWALHDVGKLSRRHLLLAINDADPVIRKNALRMVAESGQPTDPDFQKAVRARIHDDNPRARLQALIALGVLPTDPGTARALVEAYPDLKDPWLESAVVGAAAQAPLAYLEAAFASPTPDALKSLVTPLATQIAAQPDPELAARAVVLIASRPAGTDDLKAIVLENLARSANPGVAPKWTPELQGAFRALLASPRESLAALPLAARWDQSAALAPEIKERLAQIMAQLTADGQPDAERERVAAAMLGARQLSADIVPAIVRLLGGGRSLALQRRIVEMLGALPDAGIGAQLVARYPQLPPETQAVAFTQLLRRTEWSMALLQAIESHAIDLATLGPVSIHQLRANDNPDVAARANRIIDQLRGPAIKAKDDLLAKFTPAVVQPGDAAHGKQMFLQNCAVCHRFRGEGKDLAPDLTGMGAHGPAELLIHVLDPNRFVEANYYAYSVETKDGQNFDGIVARDNRNGVVLRNAAGDTEIKREDIKSMRSTGLSLMPEGFEALGGENLRDILAFLCAGENKYRLLDLSQASTVDSSKGIYRRRELVNDTLKFRRFGLVKVGDVPFEILSPTKTPTGRNLVVLKGGMELGKTHPQRVEIKTNVKAAKLHFLGGVGGWAWPCCGDQKNENLPVAKVTVHFADNQEEELVFRNGVEFADFNCHDDVPGSQPAGDLVASGQVRWFTKALKHAGTVDRLTLESYDNAVAPTFVAITAETGDAGNAGDVVSIQADSGAIKALIVGGGTSHDFNRWFNEKDVATLQEVGHADVHYTDKPGEVEPSLKGLDVLYLSTNQAMKDPALRQGIFDFANAGHGLLLVHPALWYNWNDWPEYNRTLVGGGAHGHDKFGEFEVTVNEPGNPLMAGVPGTFRISDELYHFEPDAQGSAIHVLATGKNLETGKTWPVVWVTEHPKARIVCITLGHDGKAHDLPAYQAILKNSLRWAARK